MQSFGDQKCVLSFFFLFDWGYFFTSVLYLGIEVTSKHKVILLCAVCTSSMKMSLHCIFCMIVF